MTAHPSVPRSRRPFTPLTHPGLVPPIVRTSLLASLLGLGCGAQAAPTSIQARLDLTPAALFQPGADTLQSACDAGFQLAMSGGTPPLTLDGSVTVLHLPGDAGHLLTVQTATGNALNRCRHTAMDARAYPDGGQLAADGVVSVQVAGATVSNLWQEVQRWAVSLSLVDTSGHELARLVPSLKRTGGPEDWTFSRQGNSCVWQGQNIYSFQLSQMSALERTAVRAGSRVLVTVDLPESASLFGPLAWLPNYLN